MGSEVKKQQNTLVVLIVGLIAIAIIAFAVYRLMAGGVKKEDSLVTPPPRAGSPDFGPLDPDHVLSGKGSKPPPGGK